LLVLACACSDEPEQSTLEQPSSRGDGDSGGERRSDASSDASSADGSAAVAVDAGPAAPTEPPLTLAEALDHGGVRGDAVRANLVIAEACKQQVGCGASGSSAAQCVDVTTNEWTLGALFFGEPCLDAQLDLFACYAKEDCTAQAGCAEYQARVVSSCEAEQ